MSFRRIKLYNYLIYFLLWTINLADSLSSFQTGKPRCQIKLNGQLNEKNVGEIWNSPNDLCIKYTCETDVNGTAIISKFREYCYQTCHNEYELTQRKGQCCGECVKRKCMFNNKLYKIGEMWKSDDNCSFYECSANRIDDDVEEAKINSFKKSCPAVKNCPSDRMVIKDCCPYCQLDEHITKDSDKSDFIHPTDKYTEIMSRETYMKHPCRRECVNGEPPKVCNYTFVVEWFETLSKACYDCPINQTDCYRPHCIFGDGFRRSVLVVNRMMPGPPIEVCVGDTVVADIENHLLGESTSIHWHGLHQRGTPHFDGVPQVTQCPIPPHSTFRYIVNANNPGTHWWHSHIGMQRGDGAFGALIIREPKEQIPNKIRKLYDFDLIEHVMITQDWDHKVGLAGFNSFHHSIGTNKPKNILVNGRGRYYEPVPQQQQQNITVTTETSNSSENKVNNSNAEEVTLNSENYSVISMRNKRQKQLEDVIETHKTPYEIFRVSPDAKYRFRTINSGFLNCPLEISVDNHTLVIIASDGHYINPVEVDTLVSYAGERYDFVLHADKPIGNYWLRVKGLMDCGERFHKAHQGAIIRYKGAKEDEIPGPLEYDFKRNGMQINSLNKGTGHVDSLSIAEVTAIEPDTPELLKEYTDYKFYIYYDFYDKDFPHFNHPDLYSIQAVSKAGDRFFGPQLNHISMKMPAQPLIIGREHNDETKFCNSTSLIEKNINCRHDFCECSHVIQVPLNATIELVLIDEGYKYDANHPFHLHGHDFRVVAMERVQPTGVTVEQIKQLDEKGGIKRRLSGAPVKDTVTVPDGGYTVIRFVANNPGFWIFHCHIEFHVEVGMALIFKVGDYNQMPPLPTNFPTCSNYLPNLNTNSNNKPISNRAKSSSNISFIVAISCLITWRFL